MQCPHHQRVVLTNHLLEGVRAEILRLESPCTAKTKADTWARFDNLPRKPHPAPQVVDIAEGKTWRQAISAMLRVLDFGIPANKHLLVNLRSAWVTCHISLARHKVGQAPSVLLPLLSTRSFLSTSMTAFCTSPQGAAPVAEAVPLASFAT